MAIKTITINAGECAVLPAGAEVTTIIVNGGATVSSSCGTLPLPTAYKCGRFAFFIDQEAGSDSPMEPTQVVVESVKVGNTTWIINEFGGLVSSHTTYNLHITDQVLFKFTAVRSTVLTDRALFYLYFQAPEVIWDTIEMKITDRGTPYYLKPVDATCGEYPNPA